MKNRWLMFGAVLIALVSFAFVAAACSDDDDDGNGNGEPTAAEEPANGDGDPEATEEPANGDGDAGGSAVDVTVAEFSVTPSETSVSAGTITFSVTNDGAQPHNLKVIASDLAPDALPVDDDAFVADEAEIDVVATTSDISVGETEDLVVELEAGSYVLICNVPSHYTSGMTVSFTVE